MKNNKITLKFNIILMLFLLFYLFVNLSIKFVFDVELSELEKVAFIDKIFETSQFLGFLCVSFAIFLYISLIFILSYFIKKIWNYLLVERIDIINKIDYQEALTIGILISFFIELCC
ncbi:MAG: hypothetical protein KAI43_10140 [Candidatus Aureabacteria bacterium]|nr:hypothetical protein [Candidatus Auribacterota bacterium]